ncbi:MAG TPA: BatA domain-containing protein, partial [Verrucomicrobiae bacterium]|nr:BatA domain-containing protein [Verrucomicrobiae bacterium]
MTFLQPYILWALPLIFLPVVIHLLNRLRHRSQPWAAMRFLLTATRSSTGHARLRQFLILLFRVLALFALILFLGRPLAGGWVGWALSSAPDAILVLLDRSASMETRLASGAATRREQALKLIAAAAKEYQEASHLVLIDSALRIPQEVGKAGTFAELPNAGPSDTAADLPALVQSAANWLVENKAGAAEIWIASDLQRSNWMPEDSRWKNVIAQLEAMPQKVRVRLLSVGQGREANNSVSLREVLRRQRGEKAELSLSFDFQRLSEASEKMPVSLTVDGAKTAVEVALEGQSLRWRHQVELGAGRPAGWGSLEMSADSNARDNTAYFVYGPETPLRTTVVATDEEAGRFLRLAGTIFAPGKTRDAASMAPAQAEGALWTEDTLIVWQAPLPAGAAAERVRKFVEEG